MKITDRSAQNKWLTDYMQPTHNKLRLFAFPYSGAGTVIYHSWAQYFNQHEIDLIGIQLPGREKRFSEEAITNLPYLVEELLEIIHPLTDVPFAFFGHSMGGLVAFELSRSLRNNAALLPQHLFISGFRSPDMPNPNQELHQLNNIMLLKKVAEYGGTPIAILENSELMALLLPIIRADFKLFETYQYYEDTPLNCPITTFSGKMDSIVKPDYMKNWARQTSARLEHVTYEGKHFFINENKSSIINKIVSQLK